jgi:RNA-directed DNA polymerase
VSREVHAGFCERRRVRLPPPTLLVVLVCATKKRAEAALAVLQRLLAELGLELAAIKTRVVDLRTPAEGFDFLGYHFRMVPTKGRPRRVSAACWPSRSAMAAAGDRGRARTPLGRIGLSPIMVVDDLNRVLRAWGAYFRHGNSTRQFNQLDRYVFERLARFIGRKHGSRDWRRGMVDLIESRTTLGLVRLAGTVRYASAHGTR